MFALPFLHCSAPARLRAALAIAAFTTLAAGPVAADYLWLQPADGGMAVRYGEMPRPAARLPALRDANAVAADGRSLPLTGGADSLLLGDAATAGAGDLRFTAAEPGEGGVITFRQARWGRAETRAGNDLELVPTTPGGNTFRLIWKGQAVAATRVNVDTSAGWQRSLSPDADGALHLPTPFPGLYLLEVTARVNGGSVTVDGRKYTEVRHSATLGFEVAP